MEVKGKRAKTDVFARFVCFVLLCLFFLLSFRSFCFYFVCYSS